MYGENNIEDSQGLRITGHANPISCAVGLR